MITLAAELGETTPVSFIVKKAQRLKIYGLDEAIALAAIRGCRHYAPVNGTSVDDPGRSIFPDEELVVFLISGENSYSPTAIRCAAQLARSSYVNPAVLAKLTLRLKCERVLGSIAHAGFQHDVEGRDFWTALLSALPPMASRDEPKLPHWSRYVSMAGIQRDGMTAPKWLRPCEQSPTAHS